MQSSLVLTKKKILSYFLTEKFAHQLGINAPDQDVLQHINDLNINHNFAKDASTTVNFHGENAPISRYEYYENYRKTMFDNPKYCLNPIETIKLDLMNALQKGEKKKLNAISCFIDEFWIDNEINSLGLQSILEDVYQKGDSDFGVFLRRIWRTFLPD